MLLYISPYVSRFCAQPAVDGFNTYFVGGSEVSLSFFFPFLSTRGRFEVVEELTPTVRPIYVFSLRIYDTSRLFFCSFFFSSDQSSEYVKAHGQLDLIVEPGEGQDSQEAVEDRLQSIVSLLFAGDGKTATPVVKEASAPATKEDREVGGKNSKQHVPVCTEAPPPPPPHIF